ncbi:unnamed protein product [Closterium sp. NIES-53]
MLPASPQQNGIAERRIRMVMDVARTYMIHAAVPHFLWPFAVQYAVHQINLQPRVSVPETTPTLRWMGKVGDASAFRVWGSRAFVRDLSADKLSFRAVPCVFLGFAPDAPSWQFYHPTSRRVLSSQDITFDESSDSLHAASPTVKRLLAILVTDPSFESTAASALVVELVDFAAHCRVDYAASLVAKSASVCPPSIGGECALSTDVLEDSQEEFLSEVHWVTGSLSWGVMGALTRYLTSPFILMRDPDAPDIPTPRSYAEAIEGPYSSQWQTAIDAEMACWNSTGTYVDEVPLPGANIVDGMWIFRVKRPPGSLPVFKARFVARGFSQRQGVDYFQTFSPTPKMTTLQAPGEWHDTLKTTLAALVFAPSTADPSLFLRTDTTLPLFYVLVYVDDLVFATADTVGLAHVKSELQKRHTCTDLGELRSYLGLQITRDRARRTITLTQSHMVQQVLQRFNFTYSSPQATPLSTRHSCLRMSP